MKRTLLILTLLALTPQVQASEFWSGLWRTADQQGEALMQQGDAAAAAKVYTDPHRRAYAKLHAGDYQGAAKDLSELHDSDADYNRGNALAHAGDLQNALDAYDAALKSDPANQDAKHNRELVANALKEKPEQQKTGDNKSQKDRKEEKQDKDSADTGKQDGEENKDGQGKPGEQGKQDDRGKKGDQVKQDVNYGQGEQSSKDKNEQPGQEEQKNQDGKSQSGKQAGQDKSQKAQSEQADNKSGKDKQSAAKDDAGQARRDAEASLGKPANNAKSGDDVNTSQPMPAKPAKSEKQIAQEQWLHSIPDDPGGLLRRKFLIEHMMKKQKAQQ